MNARYADIADLIIGSDAPPSAKETVAELFDGWREHYADEDAQMTPIGIEVPWYLWVGDGDLLVGVTDYIGRDETGLLLGEWKTTKAPTRWWTEDAWLESIANGPQLAVYALAAAGATFCWHHREPSPLYLPNPRMMVRAAVKTLPPTFWPRKRAHGIFNLGDADTAYTLNAARAMFRAIRINAPTPGPWQLPGYWCKKFNKYLCGFYKDCTAHRSVAVPFQGALGPSDPANEAVRIAIAQYPKGYTVGAPLIVLSQTSYCRAAQCLELYRKTQSGLGSESSIDIETGSLFHSAIAAHYGQGVKT